MEPGGPQDPGGLFVESCDLEGPGQCLHPLAQAQEDGDAGAVHEGDSGTVYHHLPGQDLVQPLVQVLEQALDPVVVDVPGEGDGEYSVDIDRYPLLYDRKIALSRTSRVQGNYTAFLWIFL